MLRDAAFPAPDWRRVSTLASSCSQSEQRRLGAGASDTSRTSKEHFEDGCFIATVHLPVTGQADSAVNASSHSLPASVVQGDRSQRGARTGPTAPAASRQNPHLPCARAPRQPLPTQQNGAPDRVMPPPPGSTPTCGRGPGPASGVRDPARGNPVPPATGSWPLRPCDSSGHQALGAGWRRRTWATASARLTATIRGFKPTAVASASLARARNSSGSTRPMTASDITSS